VLSFPLARVNTRCFWLAEARCGLTTQQFRHPRRLHGDDTPETFRPYALGYVELTTNFWSRRGSRIGSRQLRIGQEMELRIVPYTTRPDGTEILTYAFAPVEGDPS